MRLALYLLLAGGLATYAFWVYTRVELGVPAARMLALVRATVLVVVLLLLFDPSVPMSREARASTRWVLLDASLSMSATDADGRSAWEGAEARARELEVGGWRVMRFADGSLGPPDSTGARPEGLGSMLGPALQAAAEGGARQVRVLSDFRLEDAVALRAVLDALPVDVVFEHFGGTVTNAGIGRLHVPDMLQPDGTPTAEIEVHGGAEGDSIGIDVFEEERAIASVNVPAPTPGLRSSTTVQLPPSAAGGRVRYSARVRIDGDAFPDDDEAVTYANIGHEAGALVLLAVVPGWEARYLLPVLEDVTGLSSVGYLRAGPDRFVRMGRAVDRAPPVDSVSVRRAASDAAVLVVVGLAAVAEPWIDAMVGAPGRRLILPGDAEGASAAGIEVAQPRAGEWYASPDAPTSPIAGSLAGVSLQGLPPLTNVMVPAVPIAQPPLHVQLAGAGAPQSAFALVERPSGRVVVALASGFWRWAARDNGREPYRRLWSGIASWLLSGEALVAAEPRPEAWVVGRDEPVRWSLSEDSSRITISDTEGVVVDTVIGDGRPSVGVLPPAEYTYVVSSPSGDTLATGRFDVAASNNEMLPPSVVPELPVRNASAGGTGEGAGRPLRTLPWPYLLVIVLLCTEWVVRRRSGLR